VMVMVMDIHPVNPVSTPNVSHMNHCFAKETKLYLSHLLALERAVRQLKVVS